MYTRSNPLWGRRVTRSPHSEFPFSSQSSKFNPQSFECVRGIEAAGSKESPFPFSCRDHGTCLEFPTLPPDFL